MVFKVIPPDQSDISRVKCERLERYLNSPEMIEECKRPAADQLAMMATMGEANVVRCIGCDPQKGTVTVERYHDPARRPDGTTDLDQFDFEENEGVKP